MSNPIQTHLMYDPICSIQDQMQSAAPANWQLDDWRYNNYNNPYEMENKNYFNQASQSQSGYTSPYVMERGNIPGSVIQSNMPSANTVAPARFNIGENKEEFVLSQRDIVSK